MDDTRREFLQKSALVAASTGIVAGAVRPANATVDDELAFADATELARRLRTREVGSEELTRHYINRIERHDEKLNAVVVRDFERALEAAREADRSLASGRILGPLHGVPMTVKESFDVAGLPSTWGHPSAKDSQASADAALVQRFKAAGAHIMGKTNVPLDLGDFQSYNEVYGTTNNPFAVDRTPGGSSGGSAAALAAGLTGLESGSDIGGSIRNPAHFCGVYGHKPTLGVIPSRGHQPPGVPPSPQDPDLAVVGPLARSAEDLALALDVVAGPDVLQAPGWKLELPPARFTSLREARVAFWADDELCPVSDEVEARVHGVAELLSSHGAKVSTDARPAFPAELSHETYLPILNAMIGGPNGTLTYFEWMGLHGRRGFLRSQWQEFFKEWDALICPITPTAAFVQDQSPVGSRTLTVDGDEIPYFDQIFWAGLATVSYLPSTVFPTGLNDAGLPIGLQIVGAELHDRTTIELARLLAAELGGFVRPAGYEA